MLSEEALILYTAFIAAALLMLGVMDLVWPTRERHPRRRRSRDPWRRARSAASPPAMVRRPVVLAPARPRAPRPAPPSPAVEARSPVERPLAREAEPAAPRRPAGSPFGVPPRKDRPTREPSVAAPEREFVVEPAEKPEVPAAPPAESPVDRCYALWECGEHTEAIEQAMAVLESTPEATTSDADTAKLWGVVAFARQGLGDHRGARVAFEQAIRVAPRWDRPTWERHLSALARSVGETLLARARSGTGTDTEERVAAVRAAIEWLERGLEAAPGDTALHEAQRAARDMLWPVYQDAAAGLVQRQAFEAARQLLEDALAEPDCPASLLDKFRDLHAATYTGEVGQLTVEAIRRVQDGFEAEALAALGRAEAVFAAMPTTDIPPLRRQELERRLWWGYTKLGMRRVDAGMYEEAVEPLMHALSFVGVGSERLEETRGPLVRSLRGLVEARTSLADRLAGDGEREAALKLTDELARALEDALARGVPRDDLDEALEQAEELARRIRRSAG